MILVEAIIGTDGRLTNMRIKRGLAGLDAVTLQTLATWRCKAPVRDGEAVPVVVLLECSPYAYTVCYAIITFLTFRAELRWRKRIGI
jgi:Gram-negative bacterial TonB protein C-terminal